MALISVLPGQTTTKRIEASSCGFFRHLLTAQTAIATVTFWNTVTSVIGSVGWQDKEESKIWMVCYNFNLQVVISNANILMLLKMSQTPDHLDVEFTYSPSRVQGNSYDESNPYIRLFSSFLYQSFLSYYESVLDKINVKFSSQGTSWPDVLQFARVIRNSFAHDGKIEIRNPNAPPVIWNGRSYSFADNGRQVLYNDVSNGDIIVIMFEMDALLS